MVIEILIFAGFTASWLIPVLFFRGVLGALSSRIVFWLLLMGGNFVGWLLILGIFAGLSAYFDAVLPWWASLPIIVIGPTATAVLGYRFRSEIQIAWPFIASRLLWGLLGIAAATAFAGVLAYYGHEEPYSLIALSLALSTAGLLVFRYAYRRWDMRRD